MISCIDITRTFRSYQKDPGILGSLKSIFVRRWVGHDAVADFSVEIARGEIVGLLGPNGAGKTTLMKMFSGIIVPSRGRLTVMDYVPADREREFRRNISLVMGQKSQLWWDIPAYDSFLLLQRYYDVPDREFRERVEELAVLLKVDTLLKTHVRKLSLGERMKMELIAALLHQPKVLFLDEPTIGLDLVAQDSVREFLLSYHRKYSPTIILTSHYMADVEALCERVVLILGGRKRFDGSLPTFEKLLGAEKFVTFVFEQPVSREHSLFRDLDSTWSNDGKRLELRVQQEQLCSLSSEILRTFPVADFFTERAPIERVMKSLMTNPALLPVDEQHDASRSA